MCRKQTPRSPVVRVQLWLPVHVRLLVNQLSKCIWVSRQSSPGDLSNQLHQLALMQLWSAQREAQRTLRVRRWSENLRVQHPHLPSYVHLPEDRVQPLHLLSCVHLPKDLFQFMGQVKGRSNSTSPEECLQRRNPPALRRFLLLVRDLRDLTQTWQAGSCAAMPGVL